MKYKEMYHTQDLENITEELVFEQIHTIIEAGQIDVPTDEGCIQDIAAIALNRLPSKYSVSFIDKVNPRGVRLDELLELTQRSHEEVLKAIAIVQKRPHHR